MVLALETGISRTALNGCFRFELAPLHQGDEELASRGGLQQRQAAGHGLSGGDTRGGVASWRVTGGRAASWGATRGGVASWGATGGWAASWGATGGGVASWRVTGGRAASWGATGGRAAIWGATGGRAASWGATSGGVASVGVTGGRVANRGVSVCRVASGGDLWPARGSSRGTRGARRGMLRDACECQYLQRDCVARVLNRRWLKQCCRVQI